MARTQEVRPPARALLTSVLSRSSTSASASASAYSRLTLYPTCTCFPPLSLLFLAAAVVVVVVVVVVNQVAAEAAEALEAKERELEELLEKADAARESEGRMKKQVSAPLARPLARPLAVTSTHLPFFSLMTHLPHSNHPLLLVLCLTPTHQHTNTPTHQHTKPTQPNPIQPQIAGLEAAVKAAEARAEAVRAEVEAAMEAKLEAQKEERYAVRRPLLAARCSLLLTRACFLVLLRRLLFLLDAPNSSLH